MNQAFILTHQMNDTEEKVTMIHYFPELLNDEMLAKGEMINVIALPQPETNGMISELYRIIATKEFFYKYTDVPETQEGIIKNLQSENTQLKTNQEIIQASLDDFYMNILPTLM